MDKKPFYRSNFRTMGFKKVPAYSIIYCYKRFNSTEKRKFFSVFSLLQVRTQLLVSLVSSDLRQCLKTVSLFTVLTLIP